MTAPLLLFFVSAALLLQLGLGVGVALWRLRWTGPGSNFAPTDERQPVSAAAWSGWRQFRVERRAFEDLSCTQCSFHLKPVDGVALPPFKPGQFLTVRLQVANAAEGIRGQTRTITRCYSLSDRPAPETYRITVKRVAPPPGLLDLPAGIASTHLHDNVQAGDIIDIKAPAGQFFLDPDSLIPAVLICGGIGVTPMMSMLRWRLDEQPDCAVHLFQGVRHGREHPFKRTLEELASSHPELAPQRGLQPSRP